MPNLVFHISRVFDGVGDFLAQKPAVTQAKIMQLLFYHILRDAQARREIGIRHIAAFSREMFAQALE